MYKPFLFPAVQKIEWHEGTYPRKTVNTVFVPNAYVSAFSAACAVLPKEVFQKQNTDSADIRLCEVQGIPNEGYQIAVRADGIQLVFSDGAGAFYGMQTLYQLYAAYDACIPCLDIADAPGLKIRGVLLDISRGKVPTLDTLKQTADYMARCKLNHLQLYIEGISFAYPKHEALWKNETPITPAELRELDLYCRERFIDLVPCQNTLGHMTRWLQEEQYRPLAECENGFSVMGRQFPPTTLDANDPKSLAFATALLDELLPNFTSAYCNVCMDEPFELCMGKNQQFRAEKYQLYADYAVGLRTYLANKNRKMMMWGDVIAKDDSVLEELPDDIVILDWGYEAEHPVAERAEVLAKSKHEFCLCPGTNSWLSFTGLTDNMLACIRNTAEAAYRYGALGMLVTDWGDAGHLQYLPVSWAGIFDVAAYAWNSAGCSENNLAHALNLLVFQDASEKMGALVLQAGRYVQFEEFRLPCRTLAATLLASGLLPKAQYLQFLENAAKAVRFFSPQCVCEAYLKSFDEKRDFQSAPIFAFLDTLSEKLSETELHCADGRLVLREYRNALQFLRVLTKLREGIYNDTMPLDLKGETDALAEEHILLWNSRNKPYGCTQGLAPLRQMQKQAEELCSGRHTQ